MSQGARTAITLVALAALLVVGLAWGWSATTSPLPESAISDDPAGCDLVEVGAGDRVEPDQVLVSVLNAGGREGLASSTMELFVDQGFGFGERGNAAAGVKVPRAEIWAEDPDGPAAQLVASWVGKGVEVRSQATDAPGIVVVVGDRFKKLARGRAGVTAQTPATICSPPAPVPE